MNAGNITICRARIIESFIPNSLYIQCVRWKRKPIWLPTAKSKLFRVPKRPVISIEENQELQRLHNNYRTYMTSLLAFMREVAKNNEVQFDETTIKEAEEKNFQECNTINDEWNAEVAKGREIRLAKEREIRRENILQALLKKEKLQEELKRNVDEQIKKAKAEAPTFITAENIDTAIEDCLGKVVNHNRALDLDGNWYEGKYPTLPDPKEVKKQVISEQ